MMQAALIAAAVAGEATWSTGEILDVIVTGVITLGYVVSWFLLRRWMTQVDEGKKAQASALAEVMAVVSEVRTSCQTDLSQVRRDLVQQIHAVEMAAQREVHEVRTDAHARVADLREEVARDYASRAELVQVANAIHGRLQSFERVVLEEIRRNRRE